MAAERIAVMIRRLLRTDVRAIAREAKREIVNAFHHDVFIEVTREAGCVLLGERADGFMGGRERFGAGYLLDNPDADNWPDGAHLLTIGRVTLAAWGGRPS
jgi:hypothetical protein